MTAVLRENMRCFLVHPSEMPMPMDSGRLPVKGGADVYTAGMTMVEECGVRGLTSRLRIPSLVDRPSRHSGGIG